MSQSASSLAASDSGAASADPQSSPLVGAGGRDRERGHARCSFGLAGCGLVRVRSHALFLDPDEEEEAEPGGERIIIPKQISLAAGSLDLQYDMGCHALQGVSSKMEDRVLMYDLSYHPHFSGCRRAVLVAVLDGHAGSGAVSYLEANLAQHVLEEVARQIGCPPVLEVPPPPPRHNHHSHHHNHHQQQHQHHMPLHHQRQQQQRAAGFRPLQQQQPAPQPICECTTQPVIAAAAAVMADCRAAAAGCPASAAVTAAAVVAAAAAAAATAVGATFGPGNEAPAAAAAAGGLAVAAAATVMTTPSSAAGVVAGFAAVATATAGVGVDPAAPSEGGWRGSAAPPAGASPEAVAAPCPAPPPAGMAAGVRPDAEADGTDGAARMSSSVSLGIRTAGLGGSYDWDQWAADGNEEEEYGEDEEGTYGGSGDGVVPPPWAAAAAARHSAAAELRRTSLAAYDSGCGCQPPDPPAALRNALLRCERELMDLDCHSGSTALVALMLGANLWLANVGDCRAVVCDDGEARQLTVDHKAGSGRPDAPESAVCGAALLERQRLLALGAQLSSDGYLQVTAPDGSCSDIAVSRNLGCAHLKNRSTSGRGSSWTHLHHTHPHLLQTHHHNNHNHTITNNNSNHQGEHNHQNIGQHQRQQQRSSSSSGYHLSASGGAPGRISASGLAATVSGAAGGPDGGTSGGGGSGGKSGAAAAGGQPHRPHHGSAPASVSGGSLDELTAGPRAAAAAAASSQPPQQSRLWPQGGKQQQSHNHGHESHLQQQLHQLQLQRQQAVAAQGGGGGGRSLEQSVSLGAALRHLNHPNHHNHDQQEQGRQHSSHTQVHQAHQAGGGGGGGRFGSRSDPSSLTFSAPRGQQSQQTDQEQQQNQKQEQGVAGSVNGGAIVHKANGHGRANCPNGHGPIAAAAGAPPGPDSCTNGVNGHHHPTDPRDTSRSGLMEVPLPPPPPGLPRISTSLGGAPARHPSSQPQQPPEHPASQLLLQQQQSHPPPQGLSPRPPRPPSSGGIGGGSSGTYGSPQLQQGSPAPPLSLAPPGLTTDGGGSPDGVCDFGSAAAAGGGRPTALLRPGDSGSGPGSRTGSRPGSGNGFVAVGSGICLGLPPLPPSPSLAAGLGPGGSGGGGRLTTASVQQYGHHHHRRSGSGGGSSSRSQDRSLSPPSPFPCGRCGSGSYTRLSPLEEGGSSSSGVEGTGSNSEARPDGAEEGRPPAAVGGSGGSVRCTAARQEAADAATIHTHETGVAAAAAAAGSGSGSGSHGGRLAGDGIGSVSGIGGAASLKTSVTFSTWTLNSAFVHAVPEELAAAGAAQQGPRATPGAANGSATMAGGGGVGSGGDCGAGSFGAFGSGAVLSDASGAASSAAGVLIPDPDLFYYQISQDSEFLICACDGLWDVMRNGEACRYVRRWLSDGRTAAGAAEELCRAALRLGSHDNITCVVLRFSGRPLALAPSASRIRRATSEAVFPRA